MVNEDTSLDMATLTDNVRATQQVIPDEDRQFDYLFSIPREMVFAPQNDISHADDGNNIKDYQEALSGGSLGNLYAGPVDGDMNEDLKEAIKALEYNMQMRLGIPFIGKILKDNKIVKPLPYVLDILKSLKKEQPKPQELKPQVAPKEIQQVAPIAPKSEPSEEDGEDLKTLLEKENVAKLQLLFKFNKEIGHFCPKYSGRTNGIVDNELKKCAFVLENNLVNLLNSPEIYNSVLNTSADDVLKSVKLAYNYNKRLEKISKYSKLDDRFVTLSKIFNKNNKKSTTK